MLPLPALLGVRGLHSPRAFESGVCGRSAGDGVAIGAALGDGVASSALDEFVGESLGSALCEGEAASCAGGVETARAGSSAVAAGACAAASAAASDASAQVAATGASLAPVAPPDASSAEIAISPAS